MGHANTGPMAKGVNIREVSGFLSIVKRLEKVVTYTGRLQNRLLWG
jgi:hypothetical protein